MSKFERTLEGGYGYSVGRGGNTSTVSGLTKAGCECPMCYHSASNPCGQCGCPSSQSSKESKQRNESQGSTSDYSSLSPASPTPDLTSASHSSSRDDNLNSTAESTSQRSSSPDTKEDTKDSGTASHEDLKDSETENSVPEVIKPVATCNGDTWVRDTKLKSNPRRHSWAGGKLSGVGMPKQTSLQDFKKLLAQKTPSQNPAAKTSAVEMLKSGKNDSTEPFYSSQIIGGSFRKKVSPKHDHRFDAIEEQEETEACKEDPLLAAEP